jgi:putative cell wall-binding protein
MLSCITEVLNAYTAGDIKKVSTKFIHIAEIIESNSKSFRMSDSQIDNYTRQARLNEVELAYYRNKSSEKLQEMQFRYKALFK